MKKSFTPERFNNESWLKAYFQGAELTDAFIRKDQFHYSYSKDYFSISLARASVEVTLEYENIKEYPPGPMRNVEYRLFLETSGKLRAWTSDWQITQLMLERAVYFDSWQSKTLPARVNARHSYV